MELVNRKLVVELLRELENNFLAWAEANWVTPDFIAT